MSLRITSSMVRRNYQGSLNSSLGALEQTRQQASTGRMFTESYIDPNAAAKAVTLENRFARNEDYLSAVEDTMKWSDTQEDIVTQIDNLAKEVEKNYSVQALSDTNSEVRSVYADTFRSMQESMVNILNTTYGSTFALAGADGENPPFKIEDDGSITYRGVDLNDPDAATVAVLEELSKETAFIDLGFGLTINSGTVVPSSAFDAALPGINSAGFGFTAEGTPKNMIVLLGQMADELEKEDFDRDAYVELWETFGESSTDNRNTLTEIGTKSNLLEMTKTKLESENLNIIEQFDATVNIDEAEALTNYSYANYIYSLALKIGSNILTPSLLDFVQ